MKFFQWEKKTLQLGDGRELSYQVFGRGAPVLLLDGLGGSREVWDELLEHLHDRYRFVTFDYGGLRAGSRRLSGPHSIALHAQDAQAVLDTENIARCAVVGWSLGVSVALELFGQVPTRVASLVLLCGAARAPWAEPKRSFGAVPAAALFKALRLFRRRPQLMRRLLRGLQSPEAFAWARRSGLLGEQITADMFARLSASLLEFDVTNYISALDALSAYDASPILPNIDVPVLVIGGGRDPFTTRVALEALAQGIAGAEYLFLPEGTHYLLLDQPEWVNLRIEKFWSERGYAAA